MTIVRWRSFPEIEAIDRRVRTMFDDLGIGPAMLPAADIYETDEEYAFELEVPGFEEKELSVVVTDHTLAIRPALAEGVVEASMAANPTMSACVLRPERRDSPSEQGRAMSAQSRIADR